MTFTSEHTALVTSEFIILPFQLLLMRVDVGRPLGYIYWRLHSLEKSVREDLDFLKSQVLIKQEIKDRAKGYVYDIKTGRLIAVSPQAWVQICLLPALVMG